MWKSSQAFCLRVSPQPEAVQTWCIVTQLTRAVPAGRYARSLRLILRRARRAKVIPAASIVSSPTRNPMPLPSGQAHTPLTVPNPSTPAFSPSQLINSSYYPTPTPSGVGGMGSGAPGQMGPPALSPNSNFLQQASQIINDSPSSAPELADFDSLFAVETLERAGLTLGEGDQLPL